MQQEEDEIKSQADILYNIDNNPKSQIITDSNCPNHAQILANKMV